MPYIPPEKRDTSYYIFNSKFLCRVPYIATRSVDHIRHFGMPSTGYKELDKGTESELVTFYLSIAQMAEYFKKGTVVRILKNDDIVRIYEIISEHLNAWKLELSKRLNIGDAPVEDLIVLDQLANAVYVHARHQFTREIVDSLLLKEMDSKLPFTPESLISNMRRQDQKKLPVEERTEEKPPERMPMEKFFSSFKRSGPFTPDRW